ncbi:MAG: AbrB/MazE/SpoVT family DNA-binding domain-containing protein [Acidobacteriota bacterium]|nr:AbrB/MazE/SpoVT family DNA-binding domain-containing protein [Acidobacteriota bacterium]
MNANKKALSLARLSEKGQLTIPAEYRRAQALERDSTLVLVQVGDALLLVPHDEALASVTERMEAAMRGLGVSIDELVEAATEARAEIVAREFGALPDEGTN